MRFFGISNLWRRKQVAGSLATGTGSAKWSTRDYANFAREAYILNFVSFRCIDMIAQSVGSVPWGVYKRSDENREEQPDHPLNRVLHRSNPQEGFSMFQYAITAFLALDGNSYAEKIAPETGPNQGLPLELYHYRPDQIKFVLDTTTQELQGYVYERNGTPVKSWEIDPITQQCDLLQLKKFHPLNDIEGLSNVEPAARSIDTSNEALTWNKKLLENEARPGMIMQFEGALGDQQFTRLRDQLERKYSGGKNAGKNLIVEGKMKDVKPYGFSPREMDFLKGNWDLARQICLVWGVPPQIMGIPGDSTFANFEQARLYFWETTIFFYLQLIRDEYNNWFFPADDVIFVDYNLDEIPALEPRRKEKWDKVSKADFLTINEKREELGFGEIDGGDVLLINANMIPLDTVGIEEEDVDEVEEEVEEEVDEELQQIIMEEKAKLKIVEG